MDPLMLSGIGGLASGVSSLFSGVGSLFSQHQNKKLLEQTHKYNMQLAKYQYDKNMEAWHMQNEYNSPSSQMSRLKQAGLNPNLVYGNGTVTGNTTSNVPEYKASELGTYQYPSDMGFGNFGQAIDNTVKQTLSTLSLLQDLRNKKADERKTESEISKNEAETANLGKLGIGYEIANNLRQIDLGRQQWMDRPISEIDKYTQSRWRRLQDLVLSGKDADLTVTKLNQELIKANTENSLAQGALTRYMPKVLQQRADADSMNAATNYKNMLINAKQSDALIQKWQHENDLTDMQVRNINALMAKTITETKGLITENSFKSQVIRMGLSVQQANILWINAQRAKANVDKIWGNINGSISAIGSLF